MKFNPANIHSSIKDLYALNDIQIKIVTFIKIV